MAVNVNEFGVNRDRNGTEICYIICYLFWYNELELLVLHSTIVIYFFRSPLKTSIIYVHIVSDTNAEVPTYDRGLSRSTQVIYTCRNTHS